jgi:hypothetical protein
MMTVDHMSERLGASEAGASSSSDSLGSPSLSARTSVGALGSGAGAPPPSRRLHRIHVSNDTSLSAPQTQRTSGPADMRPTMRRRSVRVETSGCAAGVR